MAIQQKLYTVEDLLELTDDGKHYELARGVLIEVSPTKRPHNALTVELVRLLANHVRTGKLGEVGGPDVGFILSRNPDTVRSPDISFISKARLTPMEDNFYTIAPDLAIEIVSPGNTKVEMHEKIIEYFAAGTQLAWIFYPRSRAVYVYSAPNEVSILGVDNILDGGDVVPGFSVSLKELFAVLED